MAQSGHAGMSALCPLLGVKRTSFAHGSKRCIALIALGEEPPLAYTIHHACLLVHHCLSVDSGCLRKEGGSHLKDRLAQLGRLALQAPQVERSFVSSMENVARPARLRARLTNVSSIRLP